MEKWPTWHTSYSAKRIRIDNAKATKTQQIFPELQGGVNLTHSSVAHSLQMVDHRLTLLSFYKSCCASYYKSSARCSCLLPTFFFFLTSSPRIMDTKDGDDTNTIASVQLTETRDVLQQQSISKSNQGETLEKVLSISQADNDKKDVNLETPPPPSDEAKPKTRSRRIFERVRFVLLVIGIILSMFMISLNSTVVAPAMNIIATELDAVAQQVVFIFHCITTVLFNSISIYSPDLDRHIVPCGNEFVPRSSGKGMLYMCISEIKEIMLTFLCFIFLHSFRTSLAGERSHLSQQWFMQHSLTHIKKAGCAIRNDFVCSGVHR